MKTFKDFYEKVMTDDELEVYKAHTKAIAAKAAEMMGNKFKGAHTGNYGVKVLSFKANPTPKTGNEYITLLFHENALVGYSHRTNMYPIPKGMKIKELNNLIKVREDYPEDPLVTKSDSNDKVKKFTNKKIVKRGIKIPIKEDIKESFKSDWLVNAADLVADEYDLDSSDHEVDKKIQDFLRNTSFIDPKLSEKDLLKIIKKNEKVFLKAIS